MHTIQMHLSQKQKIFPEFFSAFSESVLNFEHFQMTLIEPVDRQHGKWAEALIQY